MDSKNYLKQDNKQARHNKPTWSTSEWSKCSQSCGGNGTQFRKVECVASISDKNSDDVTKEEIIPKQICLNAGMREPPKVQSCGLSSCPKWISQAWSPCRKSKCIAKHTGFQTRDVMCSIDDFKTVDDKYCEAVLRPRSSQTCFNRRCRGIWKSSPWSKVSNFYNQCSQLFSYSSFLISLVFCDLWSWSTI